MSFIMPYTDQGGTVHPDSFWTLHCINLDRIVKHALLIFHGWHQWQDYPDPTKVIGEKIYTITDLETYEENIALGDASNSTPFFLTLEDATGNIDNFFNGADHYADSGPSQLVIDSVDFISSPPMLRGSDVLVVGFNGNVDLDPSSLARGLVASWKLDEATGATRADAIGRTQNNLASHNNVVRNASGKVGACASFTAASLMYLSATSNTDLQMIKTGEHIVACWVKRASDAGLQYIASKGSGANGFLLALVAGAGGVAFTALDNELDTVAGITADGQWHFIVASVVLDDSPFISNPVILRVSVDGNAFESIAGPAPVIGSENGDFYIGRDIDNALPFDGLVDAFDKYYFPTPIGDGGFNALVAALYNSGSGWEPGTGDDWRTGVTVNVNGSPVIISAGTANMEDGGVYYRLSLPVSALDEITWEYDATVGIIQNVAAGHPVGPVIAKPVDNQVGEYWIFNEPQSSTWFAIDF